MKNSRKSFLTTFSVLMLSTSSLWAGTTLIANNGNDDCADGIGGFQQCLDVAVGNGDADTILLEPGTYDQGPYIYNAAITAEDYPLIIQNHAEELPIIVGGANSGLTIISSGVGDTQTELTFHGLVFQNGDNGNGGGLNMTLSDANATVEHCNFLDNKGTLGAGLAIAASGTGSASISHNLFDGNEASSAGGGAFIALETGTVTMSENTFTGNSAGIFDGGGAWIETSSGEIKVLNNTAHLNTAVSAGGAFEIEVETAKVLVQGNQISENSSGEAGGAVNAVASDADADIAFTNNILFKNHAGNDEQGQGLDDGANGGAINVELKGANSQVTLTNNTLFDNASQDSGGGIAITMDHDSQSADLYNNIVFGNASANSGADIFSNEDKTMDGDPATLNLHNNLYSEFFSNCQDMGGDCVSEGENLVGQDPAFVSSETGNFQLSSESPAVDRAKADAPQMPATDFAGQPRPDKVGSNPDMGALEFQTAPLPSPTPVPPAPPAQGGGCSLGGASGGESGSLPWILFAAAGLITRRKRR